MLEPFSKIANVSRGGQAYTIQHQGGEYIVKIFLFAGYEVEISLDWAISLPETPILI